MNRELVNRTLENSNGLRHKVSYLRSHGSASQKANKRRSPSAAIEGERDDVPELLQFLEDRLME